MYRQTRPAEAKQFANETSRGSIDPLLRRRRVLELTGLTSSVLYRMINDGSFPRPVRVSPGTVAWRQSEIAGWIAGRPVAEGL